MPPPPMHQPSPSSFAAYIPHQVDPHSSLQHHTSIYDGWASQTGSPTYTPSNLSASQSLNSLPQMSQYDAYDTAAMPPMASYGSGLPSLPSQPHSPFQDTFAPSPVPQSSGGVHPGYWVGDPYADPSLLSSYGSVTPLPNHPTATQPALEASRSSQSAHRHQHTVLSPNYAALDAYFGGANPSSTAPSGAGYYGGEQVRLQREPMAMF